MPSAPPLAEPLANPASRMLDMSAFETAFEYSIPCDSCEEKAAWRSFGHRENDCGEGPGDPPPPYYKCTDCFLTWYRATAAVVREYGCIYCENCWDSFTTPEAFSDYRKF